MAKRTYYETLGINHEASSGHIKSQYRRLAKRYHPDLNPNNPQALQQFREVQAAYEVLSDPDKRQRYDNEIGPAPSSTTATGASWTARSRAYRRYDGRPRQRPRPARPVNRPHQPREAYQHYTIEVNLAELFRGTRRALTVGQTLTCGKCRGKGKLSNGFTCDRCGGYGFVVHYQQVEVTVPPGLQPDMNIRLELSNNLSEHFTLDAPIMTDIAVTIQLRPSLPFEYHDHQLAITIKVPADILQTGGEWTIPAPEGGEITFKIPANTASGSTLTLRKRGLRNGTSQRRGNLLCTLIAQA